MPELLRTDEFDQWLRKLKDTHSKVRILSRIDRLATGLMGDVKPVGAGLSELRLNFGPGFRVYFMRHGDTVILLLCGGDKSSQQSDIEKAHHLAESWRRDQNKRGST